MLVAIGQPWLAAAWMVGNAYAAGGLRGALIAIASIAVTAGIGVQFDLLQAAQAGMQSGIELARAMAHGIAQGGFAEMAGGDFGSSFLAGFSGSIAGSMIAAKSGQGRFYGRMADKSPRYVVRRTVTAAVVGGTVSEIGGGKFANGAATAAMVHLFNHERASLISREVRPGGVPTNGRHAAVNIDLTAAEAAEINAFLVENGYSGLTQNRIAFSADEVNGKLVGMINHPADLIGSGDPLATGIEFEQNLSFNDGVSKMAFVKDAIIGTINFNSHNVAYSFAAAGDLNLFSGGYNSNSYALGLTAYAGGSITTTNGLIHRFPGLTRIVPNRLFSDLKE